MKSSDTLQITKRTAHLFGSIFPLISEEYKKLYENLYSSALLGEQQTFCKGKRILELGCGGSGHAIKSFLSQGASLVVGIDISSKNINVLKKRFNRNKRVELVQGNICNLSRGLGTFDIIYSDGVIHHTVFPQKVIEGAYRLLKPGGLMFISLYGSGGIITWCLDLLRNMNKIVSLERFLSLTRRWWPISSFLLADYLFVPIQHHYTEKEAKDLLFYAGFKHVERLPNKRMIKDRTKYFRASQVDYRSYWSRLCFGTGWLSLKAIK